MMMKPAIEDIQSNINRAVHQVLEVSRGIAQVSQIYTRAQQGQILSIFLGTYLLIWYCLICTITHLYEDRCYENMVMFSMSLV